MSLRMSKAERFCDAIREIAFDYNSDKRIKNCLHEILGELIRLGSVGKYASHEPITCPFCGCKDVDVSEYDVQSSLFKVSCSGCGASIFGNSEQEVVSKWNTRAPVIC